MKKIEADFGTAIVCISVAGEGNRVLNFAAMNNDSRRT